MPGLPGRYWHFDLSLSSQRARQPGKLRVICTSPRPKIATQISDQGRRKKLNIK